MLLSVAFPLADLRGFLEGETGRLGVPVWPNPVPGEDFLRGLGQVRSRRRGALGGFSSESTLCDAAHGLRLGDGTAGWRLPAAPGLEGGGAVTVAWRRVHHDGRAVAKLSLGLSLHVPVRQEGSPPVPLSAALRHVADLPVRVGHSRRPATLLTCGPLFAETLLASTTRRPFPGGGQTQRWWLEAGEPLVLVEHEGDPALLDVPFQRLGEISAGISVHFRWMELDRLRFPVWLLCASPAKGLPAGARQTRREAARTVRTYVERYHVETACLRRVARRVGGGRVAPGRGTGASDRLQRYLSDTLDRLGGWDARPSRPEVDPLDWTVLAALAREARSLAHPGEEQELADSVERLGVHGIDARRQVVRALEQYLQAGRLSAETPLLYFDLRQENIVSNVTSNVVVSGTGHQITNVVAGGDIENVLNQIQGSGASDDVKSTLAQLTKQVGALAARLEETDKARATQVRGDLEALAREATSEKPRKPMLEVTAAGLKEAAQTVADMAGPILATVAKLLAFLA